MQEKKIKGGPGQPGPPFILKDIGQVRNFGIAYMTDQLAQAVDFGSVLRLRPILCERGEPCDHAIDHVQFVVVDISCHDSFIFFHALEN